MEHDDASSALIVTDPDVAAVLASPDHLRFVAPFVARERTMTDVARELDVPLSTLYRRVQRYVRLGLLRVAREEARAGRARKHYRSTRDAFFVPNRVASPAEERMTAFYAHWERVFARAAVEAYGEAYLDWGQRIYRDETGLLAISLTRGPDEGPLDPLEVDAPAGLTLFHDLVYLDFEDGKALQRELAEVWRRYVGRGGAQRYAARLSLLPVPEGAERLD